MTEFQVGATITGPFEAFCQPGYVPILRKNDKIAQCHFCQSSYNSNNLARKRRHESAECKNAVR